MDIVSHIIFANALTGPNIYSTIGAVIPDLTMIKRKPYPDKYYLLMHSPIMSIVLFIINPYLGIGHFSHIFLDFFTHGKDFAPRLFYPFSDYRITIFQEWEFFNKSFWIGLFIVLIAVAIRIDLTFL